MIKSLLLNVLDNEDNYYNVTYLVNLIRFIYLQL